MKRYVTLFPLLLLLLACDGDLAKKVEEGKKADALLLSPLGSPTKEYVIESIGIRPWDIVDPNDPYYQQASSLLHQLILNNRPYDADYKKLHIDIHFGKYDFRQREGGEALLEVLDGNFNTGQKYSCARVTVRAIDLQTQEIKLAYTASAYGVKEHLAIVNNIGSLAGMDDPRQTPQENLEQCMMMLSQKILWGLYPTEQPDPGVRIYKEPTYDTNWPGQRR